MKAVSSGRLGLFRQIFNFTNMFLRLRGVISITLLILLITSIHAIQQSIEERSPTPFIKSLGGKLLNHDNQLYAESEKIERQGGILIETKTEKATWWDKIKLVFEVLKALSNAVFNLWYIYFFAFLFYKLSVLITNNSSAVMSNVILMLLLLSTIQVMANYIIIDEALQPTELSLAEKFIPFTGVYKFAKIVPLLTNPVYERVKDEDASLPEKPPVIIDPVINTTYNNSMINSTNGSV